MTELKGRVRRKRKRKERRCTGALAKRRENGKKTNFQGVNFTRDLMSHFFDNSKTSSAQNLAHVLELGQRADVRGWFPVDHEAAHSDRDIINDKIQGWGTM